jgi:putative ABC transport system permease protein
MSNLLCQPRLTPLLLAGLSFVAPVAATCAEPAIPQILVSRHLMEARGLERGQVLRLATKPAGDDAREFRVVGSYEPIPNPFILGSERFEVRLHLPDRIELNDRVADPLLAESVTRINVRLADPQDADAFERDLATKMPGLVVSPALRSGEGADPFLVLERFHLAIAVVTMIGSSAFLLALMVMRSDERRETAGILRLIGLSRSRILLEGLFEGLFVAIAGVVFGIAIALSVQGAFNRFFQWYYDTPLVFVEISGNVVLRCLVVAVPLGVLAGFLASWTLLRREILALLRR